MPFLWDIGKTVDPDQMLLNAASDLTFRCLLNGISIQNEMNMKINFPF